MILNFGFVKSIYDRNLTNVHIQLSIKLFLEISKSEGGSPAGPYEGTNLEMVAAPGPAAPGRLQEGGWAGGLPGTAGRWPKMDPAGSSSAPLSLQRERDTHTHIHFYLLLVLCVCDSFVFVP